MLKVIRYWRLLILVYILPCVVATGTNAQAPISLKSGVTVQFASSTIPGSVRLEHDHVNDELVFLNPNGNLYSLPSPFVGQGVALLYSPTDHGLSSNVLGFEIGSSGAFYLVGNQFDGPNTIATIVKGTPDGSGGHTWTTLAETEPYPRSATPFDHFFNGIAESPDGQFVFVNSGSRTDHGEEQNNNDEFPGLREIPITSAILRLPSDGENIILKNDVDSLATNGYFFADGVRNSFDLEFDGSGNLFATENSGDRDDNEEINWIREGHHYGFPWRMGTNDTPQQFTPYDPGSDPLINPSSYSASNGFFYDDPSYPAAPGVAFTDPVRNLGPDANMYRDPADGIVKDAVSEGVDFATLTPHRSPLGLVFDTEQALPGTFRGKAFVASWTGPSSSLLSPFGNEGEDLLELNFVPVQDGYEVEVERIISDFDNPIDAVLVGDKIYVLEYGGGNGIWEVGFGDVTSVDQPIALQSIEVEIYPNPSNDIVYIESDSHLVFTTHDFEIYDLLGRRMSEVTKRVDRPGRLEVDVSRLSTGLYILYVDGRALESTPFIVVD